MSKPIRIVVVVIVIAVFVFIKKKLGPLYGNLGYLKFFFWFCSKFNIGFNIGF